MHSVVAMLLTNYPSGLGSPARETASGRATEETIKDEFIARQRDISLRIAGRTVNYTFPENTEPAATGQGVVSADFSTPTGERPSRATRRSPR